ncbi:MAG: hypothetical protein ACJAQ6_001889, partial [Arenicella sp.]
FLPGARLGGLELKAVALKFLLQALIKSSAGSPGRQTDRLQRKRREN